MPLPSKAPQYVSMAAVAAWSLYLLFDYFGFHGRQLSDFFALPYVGLLVLYAAASGVGFYFTRKRLKATPDAPLQLTYRGIGAYGLVLLSAGLALAGFALNGRLPEANVGSRIFYFAGYATLHVAGVFLLVTAAFGVGSLLIKPYQRGLKLSTTLPAIALGFSVLGLVFSLLGLANLLTPVFCWGVVALSLAAGYKSLLPFLVRTLWAKRTFLFSKAWVPVVLVLMFAVLGVNLVGAFKAFPIGFDGAALYMNAAMLTADTGSLPYGGQAFGWSVIMSLGEILFGSLTMGILTSHLMNVLCILLLYQIGRRYLSPAYSLLACLLTLIAPYFVFHGLVDEKVDLAFSFIALAAIYLAVQLPVLPSSERETSPDASEAEKKDSSSPLEESYVWMSIGLLAGFAFTIKYTAVIFVLALGCYWLYQRAGKMAFTGGLLASVGLLFGSGIHRLGYIEMPGAESLPFGGALFLIGLGLTLYAFRDRVPTGLTLVKNLGMFLLTFLLAFAPWGIKNVSEHGSFSINNLIQGRSISPPLEYIHQLSDLNQQFNYDFYFTDHQVPEATPKAYFAEYQEPTPSGEETDREGLIEVNQGAREDVQRYLGYEAPFWRYLSLPYDMTVNSNLGSRLIDIGFLGLLLLPLIFLLRPGAGQLKPLRLLLLIPILLYLAGVLYSMYVADGGFVASAASEALAERQIASEVPGPIKGLNRILIAPVMAVASACSGLFTSLGQLPMWIVISTVLGLSLLLILGPRERLNSLPKGMKEFGALLGAYATLFWIMGNGVIWYAMPLFLLMPIFLVYFFDRPERFLGPGLANFSRRFGMFAIGLTILFQFTLYFTSPFESEKDPGGLFRYPFVEMASNARMNERKIQDAFSPAANEILDVLNKDTDSKIYRVSTQLGHFIDFNDRRVFSDPVLERYDEIASRLIPGEEEKFFDMLKAQGYKYILFDLRLGNVDRTPEQNLKRKFLSLAKALLTSKKVKILTTDNVVADPKAPPMNLPNGQRVNARRGVKGKTIYLGSVVLFEIK